VPHPRNSGSGVRGRLGPIQDQVIDGDIGADRAQDAAPPRLARVGIGHGGERQRHVPDRIDLHPRGCQPALLTSSFRNARWVGPLPFRFGCSAFRSAIRRARSPEKLSGRDLATSDPSADGRKSAGPGPDMPGQSEHAEALGEVHGAELTGPGVHVRQLPAVHTAKVVDVETAEIGPFQ